MPIVSPSVAKVPNSAAAPTLTMACAAVPLDATSGEPLPSRLLCHMSCRHQYHCNMTPPTTLPCWKPMHHDAALHVPTQQPLPLAPPRALPPAVSALLSLGAALGVRDTNWRNGSKCNIEGQTANFKTWLGVWCIANGTVLNITLPNKELRGIIHADISKLNALSYLYVPTLNLNPTQRGVFSSCIDVSYNIFFGQLSKLVSNLLPLTSMATLRLAANYLTGTLLAMATQLQRTSGCAVCGSATGAPPFCAGTTCTPDVAARLAAGTINNPAAALPAMFCQAVLVDDNSVLALLALRAGLGVSASSWAVDSPCKLAGNAPAVESWTGVVCDLSAQVLSLDLSKMNLYGSLHADISKLTALTSLNVASNLLDARMSEWALPLTGLKALKQLSVLLPAHPAAATLHAHHTKPLAHLVAYHCSRDFSRPTFLGCDLFLSASALQRPPSKFLHPRPLLPGPSSPPPFSNNVQFNCLAGPITDTPSASLKSLNVASNLLRGTFPATSATACDARSNCLADSSKCLASGSSSQRLSSDCTLCGAGSSGAVIRNRGVCTPDTTGPVAALGPNSASDALLPMQCSGVRIDATAVSVLGSLKAALGVPLPHSLAFRNVFSSCVTLLPPSHPTLSPPPTPTLHQQLLPWPEGLGRRAVQPAGAVVEINLNTCQLAGSMHADISKLTALTDLVFYSNLLAGRLDAFTAPFTALSKLENMYVSLSQPLLSLFPCSLQMTFHFDGYKRNVKG
ncbi:unnamed protein product [Closterium sp. NIES-64]|nr:unnamed protein product [Closterium sp. NIES-64]